MRFGVGVRFPIPGQLSLFGKALSRSRVGAAAVSIVALSGKATARQAWKSGLGSVPVITSTSFTLGTNTGFDALIGHVNATNAPTSYAITSGNSLGYFAIYNSGNLRTSLSGSPTDDVYTLTFTATNGFGTSTPKTITVTVGAVPVVVPNTFNLSLPASSGDAVGTVATTGGTPASWAITAGNAAGYFAIDNSGAITVTTAGATGITATTYNLTVRVTNALGSNTGSIGITAAAATSFPNATNTGVPAGTTLTVFNGDFATSANNQVIDSLDIRGQLRITHSNVTVSKCRIFSTSASPIVEIVFGMAIPPTMVDCLVEGPNNGKGVRINCGTLRRCQILHCADGIELTPNGNTTNGVLIEDCYVRWTSADAIPGQHPDVVEADGNHSNVTLRHNTFANEDGNNSALTCGTFWGPISNFVATNNRFIGGNFTVYLGDSDSNGFTNCTFTNNRLTKGFYDYMAKYPLQGTVIISGNVDDITGAPLNL